MSLQLQLALPLLLCAAALVVIAIVRKHKKPEVFVICAALVALSLFAFLAPLSPFGSPLETSVGEISKTDVASLVMAEQYMLRGDYNSAAEILDDLAGSNADNPDVLLARARCTLLQGNYSAANQLYKIISKAPKNEVEIAAKLAESKSTGGGAIAVFMAENGQDPEKYGLTVPKKSDVDVDDAKKVIEDRIRDFISDCKNKYSADLIVAAEKAVEINSVFDGFILGNGYDSLSLRQSIGALKGYMDTDLELEVNGHFREARLRGYTVLGDYRSVAKMADENATAEEMIILTELFLKGYIKSDDFSEEFLGSKASIRDKVVSACIKALEENKKKLSGDELKAYEARVDQLKESLKSPILSTLKEKIYDAASNGDPTVASKCYLALAKIEQAKGNKENVTSFIADALNKAQDSDDDNFRTPMSQMLNIIQGNTDSSEVKNIAQYVDNALDNSLPMDIELVTPPTEYDEDDYKPEGGNDQNDQDSFFDPNGSNDDGFIDNDFTDDGFVNDDFIDDDFINDDFIDDGFVDDGANTDGDGGIFDDGESNGEGQFTDPDKENEKDEQKEEDSFSYSEEEFTDDMVEIITQSSATLNIGVINKDNFPDVKARIQIQSSKWTTFEQIKENLKVYDCGSSIEDFELEKLEFQKSRIILLCDISGSMDGNLDELHSAVTSFADKMQEGEEVCVVGFDNGIVFIEEFTSNPAKVKKAADRLYEGGGGTALYSSLVDCLDKFEADINANNIIIAMTDGADGDYVGEGEMQSTINGLCAKSGATVYTIGLGYSVNTDYLEKMASFGNGSFLYVNEIEALEGFYDFIHGMLNNQYVLSYTAKNTTRNERKLEIAMNEEMGNANKTYYLVDPVYTDEGQDSYNPYTVEDVDLNVHGFSAKFVYKSSKDQTIELKGAGFDKGDEVSVRIKGNVRYELKAEYVDEKTYKVIIPSEVAIGTYDASISVAGNNFELPAELTVSAYGTEKSFTFGSYSFTALNSYVNDSGNTVLSGNVIMNGWLRFKGDIEVSGYYKEAESIFVTDNSGAYISYSDATSMGLANTLANEGITLSFGKLGTFRIYSDRYDPAEYKKFPVSDVEYTGPVNIFFMVAKDPAYSVYPDMIALQSFSLTWDLPFQKQLLKDLDFADFSSLSQDLQILIGANVIGIDEEFKYSNDNDIDFTMVSLPLRLSELEIKANTIENNYEIGAGVKFKAIKGMDELKFGFGVKSGKFDSIKLQTGGIDVRLMDAPIPISIGDFGIELSGFSKYDSNASTLSNVLGTTVSALFKVDCASLNAYLPDIAKLLDSKDAALATLDDCKLSLTLKEFRLSFDAKVKLFGLLEMGECKINMGKFKYSNALIGYYNEDEYGLQVAVTKGVDWETGELKLKLLGTSEVTLGYPYSGLWYNGEAEFDLGFWFLNFGVELEGDALVGIYKNSSDNLQFSVIVRGSGNSGKHRGFHLYVTEATGFGAYLY